MRKLIGCFLVMILPACSSTALPVSADAGGDGLSRELQSTCVTSVDQICTGDECMLMGKRFPASIDGWCVSHAGDATARRRSCGGVIQQVRWTNGDQEVEAYYETGGTLFLLTHWESDPPCEGSCRLACVAGQPDADLDASPHYGCGEAADDPVVPCAS